MTNQFKNLILALGSILFLGLVCLNQVYPFTSQIKFAKTEYDLLKVHAADPDPLINYTSINFECSIIHPDCLKSSIGYVYQLKLEKIGQQMTLIQNECQTTLSGFSINVKFITICILFLYSIICSLNIITSFMTHEKATCAIKTIIIIGHIFIYAFYFYFGIQFILLYTNLDFTTNANSVYRLIDIFLNDVQGVYDTCVSSFNNKPMYVIECIINNATTLLENYPRFVASNFDTIDETYRIMISKLDECENMYHYLVSIIISYLVFIICFTSFAKKKIYSAADAQETQEAQGSSIMQDTIISCANTYV